MGDTRIWEQNAVNRNRYIKYHETTLLHKLQRTSPSGVGRDVFIRNGEVTTNVLRVNFRALLLPLPVSTAVCAYTRVLAARSAPFQVLRARAPH